MNIIGENQISEKCPVTGKIKSHYFECPTLQIAQIMAASDESACGIIFIAETRWKKAQRIKSERARRRRDSRLALVGQ